MKKMDIPYLDLMFLLGESKDITQHVGGLMVFEKPSAKVGWNLEDLTDYLRAQTPVYPFNVIPEFGLFGRPSWQTVAKMDMAQHIRRASLPAPGTPRQLDEFAAEQHAIGCDRSKPLFEVIVIDGLESGGFAIYVKIHHAIIDGASGLARILASLSADPAEEFKKPLFAVEFPDSRHSAPTDLVGQLSNTVTDFTRQILSLGEMLNTVLSGKLFGALSGGLDLSSLPFTAPKTRFNGPIRYGRTLGRMGLPIKPMQAIAKSMGGTLNDALLAVVDGGSRRYLKALGETPSRPLVGLIPVSLRDPDDKEAGTKISVILCPLGQSDATMAERLPQIIANMDSAKREIRKLSKAAAASYSTTLFLIAQGLNATQLAMPAATFTVSNVPGTRDQMYLGGVRLESFHPMNIIGTGVGVSFTVLGVGPVLELGIISSHDIVPDPERLVACCQEAFDELLALAGKNAAAKSVETDGKASADAPIEAAAKAPARKRAAATRTTKGGAKKVIAS
ncbi:wax ester/triacylglycerol synthase family O-acyltransferase [uncultured Dechloromonas sp.]|uniref:wax ester/triacylglycerol synthase family O-acyltransferase n=1 Tax=uncultured Dechloromonas sp. TaxID=171719 RepID=UPI0025E204BC|nr:wax ester/triacylglycerol synthase family O-acyltransferase [uncultured Dechloromonas sp.]